MNRAAFALLVLVAACDRRLPPPTEKADASTDATAGAVSDGGGVLMSDAIDASALRVARGAAMDECGSFAKIRSAKSVGHTSIVYKLELEGGAKYAFKPNAKKMKERWRGEVAAYRLGRALGLTNVPPACSRSYSVAELTAVLGPHALDDLIVSADAVVGAVIPWIAGLQFLPLEKDPLRSEARGWLRDRAAPIPADKADLAAQISTLIVFDAITTNWDRYSGANVALDASGRRVLFIDNDAAFTFQPPAERLRENEDAVRQTERFSRSLLTSLKTLTDDSRLGDAFGLAPEGTLLLTGAAITGVRQRIENAVKIIEDKIARRSEADVLVFP